MISEDVFPIEPWQVREAVFDPDLLDRTESVLSVANGYLGLRGNLDEGEPNGIAGTYLNSYYEKRPLPYPEGGYGYPEEGQTVVNVTDGKLIRLTVDDEPFNVGRGHLHHHERILDLRAGVLRREVDWESPSGPRVRITSERMVSFVHRAVAAISYEVTAVDTEVRITLQSCLAADEEQVKVSDDPRIAAALKRPLVAMGQQKDPHGAVLVHRTHASELIMSVGMDHVVVAPGEVEEETDVRASHARTTLVTALKPGESVRLIKFLGYAWGTSISTRALRDEVAAALSSARHSGWDGLLAEQRAYLDDFWDAADVEIEGDPALQQAVRFGLFHVLQAGARAGGMAIPGKGLTGPGYDGHAFWDTEGYVLPLLTYVAPRAAADALRWRHSILQHSRDRAKTLGLDGAAYPWRTIRGEECSAYWPAGTAALHINAVIAWALERYRLVTGDDSLEAECGLEILVETARLWVSHGHRDADGVWHIDGVTGPDEYSAVADDNVFTNLMAARNLKAAAEAVARHPSAAADLGVRADEPEVWLSCAEAVHVPYDERLGVHSQSADFTRYAPWDFPDPPHETPPEPLMEKAPYFQLYRRQVVKQADLVLAMHWCPEAFTDEQKARNVDYYEKITVRDSSLSACTQAVMCAEVGHLELAHDYAWEAGVVDLRDLHDNTMDGLHIASLAGAWSAIVEGFGGLRERGPVLSLAPRLPSGITSLRFRIRHSGVRLLVETDHATTRVSLRDGADAHLPILLYDEPVEVRADAPVERPVVKIEPLLPAPTQPPGYAPRR